MPQNATKSFSLVFPLLKQSLAQPSHLKLYVDEGSLELLALPLLLSKYQDSTGWKNFVLCSQAKNFFWGLE